MKQAMKQTRFLPKEVKHMTYIRRQFDPNSTHGVGLQGEGWALINLKSSTFVGEQTHDVEWPEIVMVPTIKMRKVEAKCSSYINDRWTFHYSEKQRKGSDFFYLTLLGEDKRPLYHFLYPTKKLPSWKNQTDGLLVIFQGTLKKYLPYLHSKNDNS